MPKKITGAWRGLSLVKQTNISTAAAVDTLLIHDGEPIETEPEQLYVGTDEINNEVFPTTHRLLTSKLAGKHKGKATPHLVALFASQCMGKDTVTQVAETTAYKHKLEIDKTINELPYRSLVENDGNTQKIHTGVACAGFQISGQRGQFVEFEADLIGAGVEAVDATAKPSRVAESYLCYQDVTITRGGTFDGSTITGGTILTGALKEFSIAVKNNAKGHYLMGDSTGAYGRITRGLRYEVDLKVKFELEDATHRAALLAGTELVLAIPDCGRRGQRHGPLHGPGDLPQGHLQSGEEGGR